MKQKLIAIGSDGCRIVSAMLEAGLFTDIPVYMCDISERRLAKYGGGACQKVVLGESPFRYALSSDDISKIDAVLGTDRDTALIFVTSLGKRMEAKYVPAFVIEAARRSLKMLVIYSLPKLPFPVQNGHFDYEIEDRFLKAYAPVERADSAISVFTNGRLILHDTEILDDETIQKIIDLLKEEGTEFDASGIYNYCIEIRNNHPNSTDAHRNSATLFILPGNYSYASFEEKVQIYNSSCHRKIKI